jgi:N-methylhydantoinase A
MTKPAGPKCRIGVDVGGTFTDFVLVDVASGGLDFYKEPSTPADPSLAVERGIQGVLERAGAAPRDAELVVHGTTLGLNAIIQRKGAATALVVSKGNRDVLELARSKMPSAYDFSVGKEEPLVPRDLVFEIDARIGADGTVLARPGPGQLVEVAEALRRRDVVTVAVMLVNSYVDPTLEAEVAETLSERLNGVLVTRSASVWPEIREYERASIATMNAYVHPLLESYFSRLQSRLAGIGVEGSLYITASNGGTLSVETARERPVDTLLSGPASGVVAAAKLAGQAGRKGIISIDMGGTSCDMAVSQGGEPEYTTRTHIGDFPLVAPVVNVSTIGAGGGSVVWVDNLGILKVGPESAGADPGPVCYGQGGTRPTVTDCYLAAGFIAPEAFLGGRMRLDRAAAERALLDVADRIGIAGEDRPARAAEAALKVATAKMVTELHKGLAQRGLDPRTFTMIPFGGAGPTHAGLLAEEARLDAILIPAAPGTFCALGAILSDVKRDYVRTVRQVLSQEGSVIGNVRRAIQEMEQEALGWVRREGEHLGETALGYSADMRYQGQAYELTVEIPPAARERLEPDQLAELLHVEHARVYGFPDRESPVEIITVRVRVTGKVPSISLPTVGAERGKATVAGQRRVFHDGAWLEVPVYHREILAEGHGLNGPAIVEQEDSTVWILPGWRGRVDTWGNLELDQA